MDETIKIIPFHTCVKNNQLTLDGCHLGYIKQLWKKTIIHFFATLNQKVEVLVFWWISPKLTPYYVPIMVLVTLILILYKIIKVYRLLTWWSKKFLFGNFNQYLNFHELFIFFGLMCLIWNVFYNPTNWLKIIIIIIKLCIVECWPYWICKM